VSNDRSAQTAGNGSAAGEPAPIRLVRGQASPEEVAALVAVLAATAGSGEDPAPRHRSVWASRDRLVRAPLAHGPGAWRASALPR
jgi:hypothetical protein